MFFSRASNNNCSPVAVGGVGGSGTRLIAQILIELGFYIGSDLNKANDNLWFTLLFKRQDIISVSGWSFKKLVDIFLNTMTRRTEFSMRQIKIMEKLASSDRVQHSASWLRERVARILSEENPPRPVESIAWKEPNTHIVIDRIRKYLPQIRYIHVARNGLDMAHSSNQNQLIFWGNHFFGSKFTPSPYYSLKYWTVSHKRVLNKCKALGPRFLFLNYDKFCLDPEEGIRKLLVYLETAVSDSEIGRLSGLVRAPASIGRFKQHGLDMFDPDDISFVRQLGFDIDLE